MPTVKFQELLDALPAARRARINQRLQESLATISLIDPQQPHDAQLPSDPSEAPDH